MLNVFKFANELSELEKALKKCRRVLVTAPALADGDSIGSQLALRQMIRSKYSCDVAIINGEPLPERYRFLPEVEVVTTLDEYVAEGGKTDFDIGIIVDGGIDRSGNVKEVFDRIPVKVFIDHHSVSVNYPYTIKIVEATASSTTELIYHISQTRIFATPLTRKFAEPIYLGLIFDTGFFRHSNTTPESLELGAKLLQTGFPFTQIGEKGMLSRTYPSLKLLAKSLTEAVVISGGRTIWSTVTQASMKQFQATADDREGIIDQLFLTEGVEIAILFIELSRSETKLSLRSRGSLDVAQFARSICECGGGHPQAAGANLELPLSEAIHWVLDKLKTAQLKVG